MNIQYTVTKMQFLNRNSSVQRIEIKLRNLKPLKPERDQLAYGRKKIGKR